MRRLTALAVVIGLMTLAVAASAHGTEHIKDKFDSISWGGSDGSLPWSGSWSEIGDDGDEKKGNVRVATNGNCPSNTCMRIGALTTLLGGAIGAARNADTSDLEELELRFEVKATGSLLGTNLAVQVSDGGGWETVKEYQFIGSATDHPTIAIDEYSSEDFAVRFLVSNLLLGGSVYVDNVEITGTLIEEPTTTSTTSTTTSTTTTTTTAPSTTTTTKPPAATTTTPSAPPTTAREDGSGPPSTSSTSTSTTTTIPGDATTSTAPSTSTTTTTTTTLAGAGPGGGPGTGDGPGGSGTIPEGSGIRAAARGIQADFRSDLYGDVRTVASLNGIDFRADYNMAVEVIESSWAWIVLLGLVIAYAIVSGLDRRRRPLAA